MLPSTCWRNRKSYENLSLELSKTHEVLVLADQYDKSEDYVYDSNVNDNITIKRFGGIKFFEEKKY